MTKQHDGGTISLAFAFVFALALCAVHGSPAQPHPTASTTHPTGTRETTIMTARASGTFEVKLTPQDGKSDESDVGRMTIDKQFHGDLEGTSKGQMLTALTDVKGSAGYVAIEKVTGTLQGRAGTFVLQHSGTMSRGAQSLIISVVPDSGTGQLAGLSGTMKIRIADGKHSYDFEYELVANGRE